MRGFDNYRYRDKAPVIDLLRDAVQLAADIRGLKFNKMLRVVTLGIGRREPTMLRAWFYGSTHCPRYDSVQAVSTWLINGGFKVAAHDNVVRLADYTAQKKYKTKKRKAA